MDQEWKLLQKERGRLEEMEEKITLTKTMLNHSFRYNLFGWLVVALHTLFLITFISPNTNGYVVAFAALVALYGGFVFGRGSWWYLRQKQDIQKLERQIADAKVQSDELRALYHVHMLFRTGCECLAGERVGEREGSTDGKVF